MVVIYAGTFPFDPETEVKNFQRKQAEYEAAYRRTGDPLVLHEALMNAKAAGQLTPDWLMEALGDNLKKDRTDQTAERFRERMRHVQRYRCVRDLRQKGHVKNDALDRAVAALEATDAAAVRPTIEDSYDLVYRDLKQLGRNSEYFYLVARADPTKVPVSVTRRADGMTVINGVAQQSPLTEHVLSIVNAQLDLLAQRSGGDRSPNGHPGVIVRPTVTRG
jgi:hypothetical protein